MFESIDYSDNIENDSIFEIYNWKPGKTGRKTSNKLSMDGKISSRRKANHRKPNKTERRGLITSRVGQGYYRQEILKKWDRKCAVTGCTKEKILIASHIVAWKDSDDKEKLDPDIGILLTPNVDALFDKYLISFNENG